MARSCTDVWTTSGSNPASAIMSPAAEASTWPSSVRSQSYQPVKRFELVPFALAVAEEYEFGHEGLLGPAASETDDS